MQDKVKQRPTAIRVNVLDPDFGLPSPFNPPLGMPSTRVLHFNEVRTLLDRDALDALGKTQTHFGGAVKAQEVETLLQRKGLSEQVATVTTRLESAGLDRTSRLLLATPGVYATLVKQALDNGINLNVPLDLFNYVRRTLSLEPRAVFCGALVDAVLVRKKLDPGTDITDSLKKKVAASDMPLAPGKVEPALLGMLDGFMSKGNIAQAVEDYITRSGIDPTNFTPALKREMVKILEELDLPFGPEPSTTLDPYLAMAYQQARRMTQVTDDPLDTVRNRGSVSTWNFEVDTFSGAEEQGVIPANILAAGALDYVYYLGERLGAFRLADAVVLRWASGAVDVSNGPAAARLYRYWKLRSERMSPEERAMLYKRVLNKGNGKLLSNMVANEHFPSLWGKLMSEVATYIQKSEDSATPTSLVSKTPIFEATRQLQYTLTEHMTGMAHMQVTEMYAHLKEAMEILGDDAIMEHFGTYSRKSLWTTIERASKELSGSAPNVAALRTMAVDGNRIFRWIAHFEPGAVVETQFRALLEAAEAWILSQATSGDELPFDEGSTQEDAEEPSDDDMNSDWDS